MTALPSQQCVQGSIPGPGVICGLSLLLVLFLAPTSYSPGTPVFPSAQKPTFPNSNSIWIIVKHFTSMSLWLGWSCKKLPVFDTKFIVTNIFLIYIDSSKHEWKFGRLKMLYKGKSLANVSPAFRRRRQCKCKKCKHGIYIALLSWRSKRFTTLCGGLCQTAYLGANCSHAVHNFVRENSRRHICPQNRKSDQPSHHGQRPLLYSNSVWVL